MWVTRASDQEEMESISAGIPAEDRADEGTGRTNSDRSKPPLFPSEDSRSRSSRSRPAPRGAGQAAASLETMGGPLLEAQWDRLPSKAGTL